MQLVGTGGFTDVTITYSTPRGDDLDTRLLRAMVIKGILEQITTATVNLVNADLLAKNRGLRIVESKVPSSGTVRPDNAQDGLICGQCALPAMSRARGC